MNLGCFVIAICHELGHDVYGYGEDDGAVVLCGYAVQGLQVPQLKKKKNITNLYTVISSKQHGQKVP